MSIKFIDAVKHHKDLPHQKEAWEYLQGVISKEILDEFAKIYRNEKKASKVPLVGINLIKEFEGCHLHAYPDPLTGGLPITIGWGSTKDFNGTPFKLGRIITQRYADQLLHWEIENKILPNLFVIPYWDEMNDNQRGSIISFAYNLGANFYGSSGFETITRVLKNKEWDKVPKTLELYRNPGTSVEAGLLRRRRAEGSLWSEGLKELYK